MQSLRLSLLLSLLVPQLVNASGCAVEDDVTRQEPEGLVAGNGVWLNGVWLNGVWLNGVSFNGIRIRGARPIGLEAILVNRDALANLADAPLSIISIEGTALNEIQMQGVEPVNILEIAEGIVKCALPAQSSVPVYWNGKYLWSLPGGIALAPEWTSQPLGTNGRRVVSGCFGSLINANGVQVPISMRGPHPALAYVTLSEQQAYPLQEGTFYGDLFGEPAALHACAGLAFLYGEEGKVYLQQRLCILAEDCGLAYEGLCVDACAETSELDGANLHCATKGGEGEMYEFGATIFLQDLLLP